LILTEGLLVLLEKASVFKALQSFNKVQHKIRWGGNARK